MSESWIVAGARTPIGKFMGELASLPATELGGYAISSSVSRASLDSTLVDEVIMGQVLTAGAGQAPARQAARRGGIPNSVGCVTVNKVCGSGLYAVMLADRAIRSGDAEIVIAGGMESMSQAPHLLRNTRSGWKYGSQVVVDAIESDGLRCADSSAMMGAYADRVAGEYDIDRSSQDAWALESHQRALAAQAAGHFAAEIVAVPLANGHLVDQDGGPRADTSLERLARLKPAFAADASTGSTSSTAASVTAGNASTLSDGAAAVVVVSETQRRNLGQSTPFRIVASQVHAADPKDLFIAPVEAIRKLLRKTGKTVGDIDLFEINEAFASQTLACMRNLQINPDQLNIHGGAIALGHPIGCSGARILVTLMHALLTHDKSMGVAAACLGGGEAVAVMIEAHGGSR